MRRTTNLKPPEANSTALCRVVAFAVALVLCGWGVAQSQEGNAAGFEIDDCGTLFSGDGPNDTPTCTPKSDVSCSAIPAGDDWAQGPANHGIFDNDGMANTDPGTGDPYRAFLQTDENWGNRGDGFDPDQFGSTSDKNNNPIGPGELPWSWNGIGGGPQKNDLTNCYVYTYIDPGTGHRWVAVAAETRSNNGDSHVDVEFNFAGLTVTEDPPGSGSGFIYGNGPAGGRTVDDDFIISMDFQQGGGLPIATVRIWTETAPGVYEFVLAQDLGIPTAGVIYSATNICDELHATGGAWTHFASNGAPSDTMLSFQMVEMAADLTALGIDVDPCSPNSTVMFKTRSSQSFTAELKDHEIIAFPFEPTPECSIEGPTQVCPGDEFCVNAVETTGLEGVTFEWEIAGCGAFQGGSTHATGETVCIIADWECDCTIMLIVTVTKGPCSSTCLLLIDVDDNTPPLITCPGDIEVQCIEDVPPPDIGLVTASDDCGPVTVTWEGDASDGNTCPEVITRTYRATDFCENYSECTQTIIVHDTIPPEIVCPPDASYQCIDDVPPCDPNDASAADNCGPVTVVCVGDEVVGSCPTIITRTYRATDACGNANECSQIITVEDTVAPDLLDCPADVTVQCIEDVPPPPIVTATDNCDGVLDPIFEETSEGVCPIIITRTWRICDDCGNCAECTQIIIVDDTIPPTVACGSGDVTISCGVPYEFQATATDNCDVDPEISCSFESADPLAIVLVEVLGNGHYRVTLNASNVVTVTCTATDDCGNDSAPCSFTISATCDQACSPGYWRQSQHFDEWCAAGYQPVDDYCGPGAATLFVDAFNISDFSSGEIPGDFDPGITLLEAVSLSGGDFNQALFLGSASLLNAAHPGVGAGAGVAQVQQMMQNAFAGTITFAQAKTYFAGLIAQESDGGCPLN